jgi:hypothetical protein
MGDVVHIGAGGSSWGRMDGESSGEYALFEEYVRLGDLKRVASGSGVSLARVKRAAQVWDWKSRKEALVSEGQSVLTSSAFLEGVVYEKAVQLVAEKLLELGLDTLTLRDPSLIPVETAQSMVRDAVGILKGRDAADINVKISREESVAFIDGLVGEILDAEVIDETE